MRRRTGIGAIQKQKLDQEKYKNKGNEIQENQIEQMSKQLDIFRSNLEDFASKHKNEIKKNPQFRQQFQSMCASIGVDPLASGKGFWSVLGIGDFYYELSVQVIEVCLSTNYKNGGLISMEELIDRLIKTRGKKMQEISSDDIICAVKKLKKLGNGFSLIQLGKGEFMVQSVPGEMNMDQTAVLQHASGTGNVSVTSLCTKLNWENQRAERALEFMMKEGLAWIDLQDRNGKSYWFPSLFPGCSKSL
jgi:ESCRT-II complex subunit VPS22